MTGQEKPRSRQTPSMATAISALAMCVQFQVSRKCTPWTAARAMCAASVAAWGGRGEGSDEGRRHRAHLIGDVQKRKILKGGQTFASGFRVAGAGLIQHEL